MIMTDLNVRVYLTGGVATTLTMKCIEDVRAAVTSLASGKNINHVSDSTGNCHLIIASHVTLVEHSAGEV